MPTPTIKTKIAMDGEKEYKAALSEINGGLKVLDSEMKKVSAQFLDNGNSVEALSAKNDVLNRQISSQKEKIETLRDAMKNSAQAFGESDSKTMKWQTSLNNAEADLAKLNHQLSENEQAMEATQDAAQKSTGFFGGLKDKFQALTGESKGLGDAIGDVSGKLGVNLPGGSEKALNSLGSIPPAAIAAAGGIAALTAGIIAGVNALEDAALSSASSADTFLTLSAQTGLSTQALQEFSYASDLLDVSVDTLQGSLTKLTNNMHTVSKGTEGEAKDAFDRLGVSVVNADGSLRDANKVFLDVIDALGDVSNATERDALSMDIFGKSAQDLNPLIIQGSDALAKYAQEANEVGYVMDEKILASLGAVDDAQQRLLKTQEAVANQISSEFAPYMEEALGDTAAFIRDIGDAFVKSGIIDSFGQLLTSSTSILASLAKLSAPILELINGPLKLLTDVIAFIADTVKEIIAFITGDYSYKATNAAQKAVSSIYKNVESGGVSSEWGGSDKYMWNGVDYSTGERNTTKFVPGIGYIQYDGKGNALSVTQVTLGPGEILGETAHYENYYDRVNDVVVGNAVLSGLLNNDPTIKKWLQNNASGHFNFPGGLTSVSENGPEVVELPRGTRIYTNQESRRMGGGDVFYVTIDAKNVKEFNDIVEMARAKRRTSRMEVST